MPKVTNAGAYRSVITKRRQKAALERKGAESLSEDQINRARDATKTKLASLLLPCADRQDSTRAEQVGIDIEEAIFTIHGKVDSDYRAGFRRAFTSLKRKDTNLSRMLLNGDITAEQFVTLPIEKLMSEKLRKENEKLKKESMRQSTIEEAGPADISAYNDGRTREKWGVEKSAAAIDEFDA